MSIEWYVVENGQQVGPIDSAQLKQRAQQGALQPDDLIWKEGLAEWVPARKVKGLFAEAAAAPPGVKPPPPLPGRGSAPQPAYSPQPAYPGQPYAPADEYGDDGYGDPPRRPDFPYPPKTVNSLFTWYLGLLIGLFPIAILGAVLIVVMLQSNQDAAAMLAIPYVLILAAMSIGLAVVGFILLYRCWQAVEDMPARTTPGKAIGFLFIPFFNLYWMFVAHYGLAQDMEAYCRERGIRCAANSGFALAVCIVGLIPYVGAINVILYPIMMSQLKTTAATISAWHRAGGGGR